MNTSSISSVQEMGYPSQRVCDWSSIARQAIAFTDAAGRVHRAIRGMGRLMSTMITALLEACLYLTLLLVRRVIQVLV